MVPDAVALRCKRRELIQVTAMPRKWSKPDTVASIERQIKVMGAFLGVPFCLLRTEMQPGIWGLAAEEPCSFFARRQGIFDHRMCFRALGSDFQRSDVLTRS